MNSPSANKSEIRSRVRARRRDRTAEQVRSAGAVIAAHLRSVITGPAVVAAFASMPTEPDMAPVLEYLHELGCEVRLPRVGRDNARAWSVHLPGAPLSAPSPGRPPAPDGPTLPAESLAEVDLVLAPAIAVDPEGNRVGQGGGWYDRALAHKRPDVPVYAVVFDEEFVTTPLPSQHHDFAVDGVCTPAGFTPLPR